MQANDNYYTSLEFAKYGTEKKLLKGQKEIHNWEFYTSGTFLNYITRSDAVYIQNDFENTLTLKQDFINSNLSFKQWYASKSKYSRNSNASGAYKLFNDAKDISLEDMKQELSGISKQQHIWEMIINLGKDGEDLFFVDKNKWADVLNKTLPKLLKKNNLSASNVNGYWAIHCNTGNPHIHLSFWEKAPSIQKGDEYIYKPKGAFNKASLTMFEKIFKAEITSNAKLEEIRDNKKQIWEKRKDIKKELKNSLEEMNKELMCLSKVKAIKKELDGKNNKTFANLSEENKQNVLEIFQFLLNSNQEFKQIVENYQKSLGEIENKTYPNDFLKQYVDNFLSKENSEFSSQIGNIICKSISAMQEKDTWNYFLPKKRKSELDWLIKRWEWEANRMLWIKEQKSLRRFEKEILNN
ncbi:relaxase MobL [Mycoplasma seminis]|uniref:ICEF Integrative Conjugal Element-II n=1 Tax=Mycoplasma seminis TaxID=512749 RepID=A0ABY9H9G2_9MOLU|nr:hypothetical protein [Mycoplasma seminis]WLP85224.1 hypothetical protein Q8852_02790 [Mycoplasma seminis]